MCLPSSGPFNGPCCRRGTRTAFGVETQDGCGLGGGELLAVDEEPAVERPAFHFGRSNLNEPVYPWLVKKPTNSMSVARPIQS